MYLHWFALLLAAGGALYICLLMMLPFFEVLAWASVLVIVFYPAHRIIASKFERPGWSALLSTILVVVIILVPISLVTTMVVNEMTELARSIPERLHTLLDPNSPVVGRIMRWLDQYLTIDPVSTQKYLLEWLNQSSEVLAGRTLGLVGGVFGAVIKTLFIIFTMYYLFRDSERLKGLLFDVIPLEREQSQQIFNRTREVIYASVYGVIVIAAIQGTLGGLAFWVLRLPSPAVWGVVMFLLSMIPLAGSYIVWVPIAVTLAMSGDWGKALMLTLWGALVIGTIDNFLRPKLIGGRTRLHELLIFFSILGGLQIFGVLGLVLGPVIVAITLALIDVFKQLDRTYRINLTNPAVVESRPANIRSRG